MSLQTATTLLHNSPIHIGFLPNASEINLQIMDGYSRLNDKDILKRSHFFGGRHENLYLEREQIPAIMNVLKQAQNYAASLLGLSGNKLRNGFWVNDMGPDAVTTEHDHDDFDELLSGVYYVQVPENSGELVIVDQYSRTLLKPQPGMFVFFSPTVRHSVSMNLSGEHRISIGMNFGPMPD